MSTPLKRVRADLEDKRTIFRAEECNVLAADLALLIALADACLSEAKVEDGPQVRTALHHLTTEST